MKNVSWFIFVLRCTELAAASQAVPFPDEGPAVFVFRIISVGAAQRDPFVACLAKNELPFWRGLKEKGLLAKVSVFETTSVTSSEPGVPAWNFVISSELAQDATADLFLEALGKRKGCNSAPGIELRRIETLKTTPNTHYARATAEGDRIAREKVEFSIEYIAVDPAKLDRWNEIYSLIGGPAKGLQIQGGTTFSAEALLTVKVNYSQPGMPGWNTIHVLGGFLGGDATAKRAASDAAIRQVSPDSGSFRELMAQRGFPVPQDQPAGFHSFVAQPRVDRARQLFELAVR